MTVQEIPKLKRHPMSYSLRKLAARVTTTIVHIRLIIPTQQIPLQVRYYPFSFVFTAPIPVSSYLGQYSLHIAWHASRCSLWDIPSGFSRPGHPFFQILFVNSASGSEPIFSSYLTGSLPSLPASEQESVIIYQTKVERAVSSERSSRSSEPNPPVQNRRDRSSRFGPETEKANCLPAKPVTAPVDSSANFSHLTEAQLERRSNPHISPMQARAPEPPLTYPPHSERGRRSPARSENSTPAPCKQ